MNNFQNIPEHIAIIPDGNRRWAKKHNISLVEAYDKGIRKLGDVLKWAKEIGVKTMSLWGFSTENFNRSGEEKSILFQLFDKFLSEGLEKYEKEWKYKEESKKIKINFLGRIYLFPKSLREKMEKVMEITKNNGPYTVNFLMAYGGRAEIIDAINALLKDNVKEVDEETFARYLYTAGQKDPDLIIRTSGEKRLSGLMLWQSAYSELYFCDKLWPDFSKEDFIEAIKYYEKRKRKFGK